jgi:hypothetical protein
MMPMQRVEWVKFVVNRRLLRMFLLVSSALFCSGVQAVEVDNLYRVDIAVKDRGGDSMSKAQLAAFKQVLIRIGGTAGVLENPLIKAQLSKTENYMLQFGYLESEDAVVRIEFDSARINRLLRQANEGVWGNRRPLVMLWLAKEKDGERTILADSSHSSLPGLIKSTSERRGLPVLLPLMDLDDAMQVSVSDIWGRFQQPLSQASARYAADAQVSAKLFQQGETWVIDWQLVTLPDNKPLADTVTSKLSGELERIVPGMVDQLADQFAAIYAVAGGSLESDELTITVTNVEQPDIYVKVMRQLASLTQVSSVEVVSFNGSNAVFKLGLLGDPASVLSALELDEHLVPLVDEQSSSEEVIVISRKYAWLP